MDHDKAEPHSIRGLRAIAMAVCMIAAANIHAGSWTLSEASGSYSDERIEATQSGGESDTYTVEVPAGKKATVHVYVNSVNSSNIGGKSIYLKWNGGSEQSLSGEGSSDSHSFTANGSVTIGVRCSAGSHEVPHERVTYIGGKPIYSLYYTTEYWKYYQCAVVYDISVSYESLLPDLTVSKVFFSEDEVPVGGNATLYYTVENAGGKPAAASTVHVYDNGTRIGMVNIGGLDAEKSSAQTYTLKKPSTGTHTLKVVADATDTVEEGSESNNEAEATLVVYERNPYVVRFDANGGIGDMADQSFVAGTPKRLAGNAFRNGDLTFMGWATSPSGDAVYADGEEVRSISKTGGTVTLYAVWRQMWEISGGVLTKADTGSLFGVAVPDGVATIGEDAFAFCENLSEITLPSSVTRIDASAFWACKRLTHVNIPNGVRYIGEFAFSHCWSLPDIRIPATVEYIGLEAFAYNCFLLRRVIFEGDAPRLKDNYYADNEHMYLFRYRAGRTRGVYTDCTVYVKRGSQGWGTTIPGTWVDGVPIEYYDYTVDFDPAGGVLVGGETYLVDGYISVGEERAWETRPVDAGSAIGTLPVAKRPGYAFAGWFTAPEGGTKIGSDTVVDGNIVCYAHWAAGGGSGSGGGNRDAGDASSPWTESKMVALNGAVYDANGEVAGVVQLKVGKPNAKKRTTKVSGTVTLLDGKKTTLKGATVNVPEDGPISASLTARGLGTLSVSIGDGGFSGLMGDYAVASATVGGDWTRGDAAVSVSFDGGDLPEGARTELLPDGDGAEPIIPKAGKWSFAKAAAVKWAKDRATGDFALSVDDTKGKTNLSSLKLTYAPKTGMFKGSFKLYAVQNNRLKKFSVKVSGVVVDGEGIGRATIARPTVSGTVRVE